MSGQSSRSSSRDRSGNRAETEHSTAFPEIQDSLPTPERAEEEASRLTSEVFNGSTEASETGPIEIPLRPGPVLNRHRVNPEEGETQDENLRPDHRSRIAKAAEVKAESKNVQSKTQNRIHSVEVHKCDCPSTEPESVRIFYTDAAFSHSNTIHVNRHFHQEAAKRLFDRAAFHFTSAEVFRSFYLSIDVELLKLSHSFTIMHRDVETHYKGAGLVKFLLEVKFGGGRRHKSETEIQSVQKSSHTYEEHGKGQKRDEEVQIENNEDKGPEGEEVETKSSGGEQRSRTDSVFHAPLP